MIYSSRNMNRTWGVSIEMTSRAQGNEFRSTQVCVDDRRDGRFSGRLYNPYWEGGVPFSSVMEFLIRMEELLMDSAVSKDQLKFGKRGAPAVLQSKAE